MTEPTIVVDDLWETAESLYLTAHYEDYDEWVAESRDPTELPDDEIVPDEAQPVEDEPVKTDPVPPEKE